METHQLEFVLAELHFSADLPRDVLEQIAAESTLQRFPAGAVVFREGCHSDSLYLIRSGRLALEMTVPGRGAVRILTLGQGEMVGWSALLERGKMTAGAVAIEDTEVVAASAEKLRELSDSNREFGYHVMRRTAAALSRRLVATRLQLLDLFSTSSPDVSTSPRETTE